MFFHKKLKVSDKENINYEFLLSKNHEISKMSWWRLLWCYNPMNKIHIFLQEMTNLWKTGGNQVFFLFDLFHIFCRKYLLFLRSTPSVLKYMFNFYNVYYSFDLLWPYN